MQVHENLHLYLDVEPFVPQHKKKQETEKMKFSRGCDAAAIRRKQTELSSGLNQSCCYTQLWLVWLASTETEIVCHHCGGAEAEVALA